MVVCIYALSSSRRDVWSIGEWIQHLRSSQLLEAGLSWLRDRRPKSAGTRSEMVRLCAPLPWHDPLTVYRLVAVNAVSLAFALIANLFLLLNMSGRVSFAVAQPITCIGFFMAAVILIVLEGLASSSIFRLHPSSDHALSQAFYYAIWAAAIYTIIDGLMIMTVVGAMMGKYAKKFNLSTSQRTLMLQTIAFVVYLLLGALIYSKLEGWTFLDALFWADYTLLTIGIGSPYVPKTHTGRGLLFPYAIGGVITIGLIIGSIRSMILEQGKAKMHARATEKKRERVFSIKDQKHGSSYSTKWRKQEKYLVEAGIPTEDRRRKEFHAMRDVQKDAHKHSQRYSLASSTFAACILWFVGALVFKYTEYKQGWSYFDSLYFAYTSLTTIGYGDLSPVSNSGKPFFVFWSILAIPTLTILISDMGDTVIKGIADATNYIGTLTILPGEDHAYSSLKTRINVISHGHLFKNSKPPEDARNDKHSNKHRTGSVADLVATRLSNEELFTRRDEFYPQLRQLSEDTLEPNAQNTGTPNFDPDLHFYRFLLVKETRNLLLDMSSANPKKYTYDEWAYFLRLIGHDESNPSKPIQPTPMPTRSGSSDNNKGDNGKPPPEIGRIVDTDGNIRPWSWLSIRSPLMSSKEESEWILHALLSKLERELMYIPVEGQQQQQRRRRSSPSANTSSSSSITGIEPSPPPVRLTEIRRRLRARDDQDAPHRTTSGNDLPDDSSQTERKSVRRRRSDDEGRHAAQAELQGGEGVGDGRQQQQRGGSHGFAFPLLEAIQDRGRGKRGKRGQGGAGISKTRSKNDANGDD